MKPSVPYLPSVGRLLGFASKNTNLLSEKMLSPTGLSVKQWIILTILWRKDGATVGELAAYYRATEPSTSNLIARMEKKGLVARVHGTKDRRQVRIYLTEESKNMAHLIDFYEEVNTVLLKGFEAEEIEIFSKLLQRVIDNTQQGLSED